MVEIVKGDLTILERGLMTAMIVLDVHGRDVILELYEEDTKNIHDFQWAKVLKYFWEEDIDNCMVR
jgi:dynein heavy chain